MDDHISVRTTSFRTAIPSSSSLNEFWPESKQFVAVPHDLQKIISSPISAIYVGLNLLLALCTSTRQQSRSILFEQQYPWISDTGEELWHYFRRWSTADKRPLHDETVALYMQLVDTLAISGSEPEARFSSSGKAAAFATRSVAHLIESLATSPMSDSNQIQLALLLTRLCNNSQIGTQSNNLFDRRRQPFEMFGTELLKQSARGTCENAEVFSSLQKDLQVRATTYP